jgi:biopolymer transport protein ExbD
VAFNSQDSSSSSSGRSRGSRFHRISTLSEINVVPLVDVLLVLLVIFMMTAQMMEYGLEVEVPEVRHDKQTAEILPVITITRTGETYLGDRMANLNELGATLKKRFPRAKEVYVKADASVTWRPMAQVISELNDAKVKVKLVTKPADASSRMQ